MRVGKNVLGHPLLRSALTGCIYLPRIELFTAPVLLGASYRVIKYSIDTRSGY